jgi:parallel beta-helix repeat protein
VTANGDSGILLIYSNNNVVSGNNVTANNQGIEIDSSSNNIVGGNDVTANAVFFGIYLQSSSDNIVSGNNATANNVGIQLESSSNNTVSSNNVTASNTAGIALDYSSNNTIYHNNFINNTLQFLSRYSTNTWDNGYPSGGNYWSDYQTLYPNASEIDSSGIWNTPYVINFWFGFAFESETNNTDNYPLMTPVTIVPEFPSFLILPLFLIATLLAVIIYKKKAMPYKRL